MRNALVLSASICALAGTLAAAGLAGAASAAPAGAPRADSVQGGIISTVAGGVGGPGRATSVAIGPCGARWAGGWLYIGDGSTVRRVSMATDALTTVAGDNAAGPLDGSGTAAASPLRACSTTLDGAGNLVIAAGGQVLLVAASTGTFYGQAMTVGHTYAIVGTGGNRDDSPDGDGGPATSAVLSNADDVAFDQAGNLVLADSGSPPGGSGDCPVGSLVRVVAAATGTFYGQNMTAGDIYTVAGVQDAGCDLGAGSAGGPAATAWLTAEIGSVRPDRDGNLILTEIGGDNPYLPPIPPSVQVIAEMTGTFYGVKMTAGHIYRVAGNGQIGSGGDGGPATRAPLDFAGGAVAGASGNLVIADNSRVRVVAARTGRFFGQAMTAGGIYEVAGGGATLGDGGPATSALLGNVGAVAVSPAGSLLVADGSDNRLRAISP